MSYGYPPDPSLPPPSDPDPDFESVYLAALNTVDALNGGGAEPDGSEMRELHRKFAAYEEGR